MPSVPYYLAKDDPLAAIRGRMGIAITPADRAERSPAVPAAADVAARVAPAAPSMAPGIEASADRILRGRFGAPPNERGAIDVAPGGSNGYSGALGAEGNPVYSIAAPAAAARIAAPRPGIDVRSYAGSRYAGNNDPRGITPEAGPGIDVNSYVGSRYASYNPAAYTRMGPHGDSVAGPGVAPVPPGGVPNAPTMLPGGNPQARDAMLRLNFPNATRAEVSGLANFAYNRPGEFNRSMGGGPLDPAMVGLRVAGAAANVDATQTATAQSKAMFPGQVAQQGANLAATVQGTQIHADDAARRVKSDTAAQGYFGGADDAALATAARAGASAETLMNMAQLAEARKRNDQAANAGYPDIKSAAAAIPEGAHGQVSQTHTGRFVAQFQTGERPMPQSEMGKLMAERDAAKTPEDRAAYDRAIANVHAGQQDRPLSLNEFFASESLARKFSDDYGAYRAAYSAQAEKAKAPKPGEAGKPGAAASAPAGVVPYKTAEDVRAAFRAGTLKREEATQILQKHFGLK